MRFFFLDEAPNPLLGPWTPPKELQHHVKALRFGAEETFLLLLPDGSGLAARVLDRSSLELLGPTEVPKLQLHPTHLATAWPKGKRAEDLVIRACEAGVTRIQPTLFERSISGRESLSGNQIKRFQRLIRETCQQLGRTELLELVADPLPWQEIRATEPRARAFCLHPGAPPLSHIVDKLAPSCSLLLVGPEGGISAAEKIQIEDQGWVFVGLLPTILRTEAAGPLAAALIQHAGMDKAGLTPKK
ncbi:MAG: 16S rRNA (uracil(1498)-N(3))-methyltransferase [Planctomycetes bacterium]|nr:16S rRNA (uracil(1498)-N(3))-methyltransferase [Planctomycetota bacterium]